MGIQQIDGVARGEALRAFTVRVLRDLSALETMVRSGAIIGGPRRLGAEQELCLVDATWHAAPVASAVLSRLADEHYTPELGAHQAEINLDPLEIEPGCFDALRDALLQHLARMDAAAREAGASVLLTGILPTLSRTDMVPALMMPQRRYHALDSAVRRQRGERVFHIDGLDELLFRDHSVVCEAATTSFQVHLQVGVAEFAMLYNAAQAVAGIQLAAGSNSPLLFGQRLWSETRVPLFQQAADTRVVSNVPLHRDPRATFGRGWVRESPIEVIRDDVASHPLLLVGHGDDDPFAALARGEAPTLAALRIHLSTVYRWNRVCYGVTGGLAHLRIENRVLPAGPTVLDEVANAAFWIGLVLGVAGEYGDVGKRMSFDDARENFFTASRSGVRTELAWVDGVRLPARELIARVLPLAQAGLLAHGIGGAEAEHYLDVIAMRVASGRTGAEWLLASDAALRHAGITGVRAATLAAATGARQREQRPVHTWELAHPDESVIASGAGRRVTECLATEVAIVREDDAVALARGIMEWRGVDHAAVEDIRGELVGMLSRRTLDARKPEDTLAVSRLVDRDAPRFAPDAKATEVRASLEALGESCGLVAHDGRFIGLVTIADLGCS